MKNELADSLEQWVTEPYITDLSAAQMDLLRQAIAELRKTDQERLIDLCENMDPPLTRLDSADLVTSSFGTKDNCYYAGKVMAENQDGSTEENVLIIGPSHISFKGFFVQFWFTADGKILQHGIYE